MTAPRECRPPAPNPSALGFMCEKCQWWSRDGATWRTGMGLCMIRAQSTQQHDGCEGWRNKEPPHE